MTINVTLNASEMLAAAFVGVRRHVAAIARGLADKHGLTGDKDGWGLHIEGAAGEVAAAKALGRYWSASVNTFKAGYDVDGIQIRTRSQDHYDLIIRANDPSDAIFVLVTGASPNFKVHGWILAGDGKCDEFVQSHGNRPPAWFVPQSRLNSIESLIDHVVDSGRGGGTAMVAA